MYLSCSILSNSKEQTSIIPTEFDLLELSYWIKIIFNIKKTYCLWRHNKKDSTILEGLIKVEKNQSNLY